MSGGTAEVVMAERGVSLEDVSSFECVNKFSSYRFALLSIVLVNELTQPALITNCVCDKLGGIKK